MEWDDFLMLKKSLNWTVCVGWGKRYSVKKVERGGSGCDWKVLKDSKHKIEIQKVVKQAHACELSIEGEAEKEAEKEIEKEVFCVLVWASYLGEVSRAMLI